jgi:ABC-2 type transport system permease protein
VSATLALQVGTVARRSILRTMRQPAMMVPALVFPLLLLSINSGGLNAATHLPGFPTDSYLTFALGLTFVQGSMFAAMSAGTNMAMDIETGFFNRLSLTPLRRMALLTGQLSGVVVLGLIKAATFLAVGLAAGAGLQAGPLGVPAIVGISLLTTLGFGSIGAFVALRTGSGEVVQGLFPLFFATLFLSSMALPRNVIEIGWFRTVATWNPVSYILEGIRSVLIDGWNGEALALGFLASGGLALVGLVAASSALKTGMVRT